MTQIIVQTKSIDFNLHYRKEEVETQKFERMKLVSEFISIYEYQNSNILPFQTRKTMIDLKRRSKYQLAMPMSAMKLVLIVTIILYNIDISLSWVHL